MCVVFWPHLRIHAWNPCKFLWQEDLVCFVLMRWLHVYSWWRLLTRKTEPWREVWEFAALPHFLPEKGERLEMVSVIDHAYMRKPIKSQKLGVWGVFQVATHPPWEDTLQLQGERRSCVLGTLPETLPVIDTYFVIDHGDSDLQQLLVHTKFRKLMEIGLQAWPLQDGLARTPRLSRAGLGKACADCFSSTFRSWRNSGADEKCGLRAQEPSQSSPLHVSVALDLCTTEKWGAQTPVRGSTGSTPAMPDRKVKE